MDVDVGFDATGLDVGSVYTATLVITSTDPFNPVILLPVRLTVGEAVYQVFMPLTLRP
jgi:hypothetical protein